MATNSLTWNWCPEHKSEHIYVERGLFFCAKCDEPLRPAHGERGNPTEVKNG
jgi:hypothetical protein